MIGLSRNAWTGIIMLIFDRHNETDLLDSIDFIPEDLNANILFFNGFSEREILVLGFKFGSDFTYKKIAEAIAYYEGGGPLLTRERIRQLLAKGLRKLRSPRNVRRIQSLTVGYWNLWRN